MTNHTVRSKPTLCRRLILFVKLFVPVFLRKFLRNLQKALLSVPRNLNNIVRYGLSAPMYGEIIFIDPKKVLHYNSKVGFDRKDSGLIIDGDWDKQIEPLTKIRKIRIVYEYCEGQKTWDECGAYKNMAELMKTYPGADGCFTEADVVKRYERLSELITHLKSGGEFLKGERENGVCIHIGRQGQFIFGCRGAHRLAIAQKLNLPIIPCQIGVVHAEFLRENPSQMKALRTIKELE